jgi:predicted lipoprotein with Yx(FWY)xxD motif
MGRFGVVVAALAVFASAVAASAFAFHGAKEAASAGSVVKLGRTPLGRVLVDQRGRTLYLFEADRFGRSACSGKCAVAWPPLLTSGTPHAGAGVKAALLGTTKRADGKLQVTYQGYPVYTFFKDTKPGQAGGQGLDFFGGEWYVLDAQGRKIEDGHHGGPAALEVTKTPLGGVLTDDRGRSVYMFEADKGGKSACYGACSVNWPPLVTTGKPTAGMGALASLLGTTKRKNGALQVTYRGQPLYYFVKDHEAGETFGQKIDAFGGEWYAIDRAGHSIEKSTAGSTGGDNSTTTTPGNTGGGNDNGGGGYTYP